VPATGGAEAIVRLGRGSALRRPVFRARVPVVEAALMGSPRLHGAHLDGARALALCRPPRSRSNSWPRRNAAAVRLDVVRKTRYVTFSSELYGQRPEKRRMCRVATSRRHTDGQASGGLANPGCDSTTVGKARSLEHRRASFGQVDAPAPGSTCGPPPASRSTRPARCGSPARTRARPRRPIPRAARSPTVPGASRGAP
jgi:hypothetical protein